MSGITKIYYAIAGGWPNQIMRSWKTKGLSIGLIVALIIMLVLPVFPTAAQEEPPVGNSAGFYPSGQRRTDFVVSAGSFVAGEAYNATLPSSISSGDGFSFSIGNHTFTYKLSGGKMQWTSPDGSKTKSIGAVLSSTGAIQQAKDGYNEVVYRDAFLYTEVVYQATLSGIKELFVLERLPANDGKIADSYLEYTGELTWDLGLSVWVDGVEYPDKTFTTSSEVEFKEEGVFINETGEEEHSWETVFSFLAPVAWDSSGSICSATYDVKVSGDKIQYGLRVPYSWLETATLPVTIDPSFTARTETYFNASSLSSPYDATVSKPTGTTEGDILFGLVCWYGSVSIDAEPSGWTKLGDYTANSDRYALYYKIAGSSEPSSYTWSFSASAKVRIVCSCYTGGAFDANNPIDAVSNTAYRTSDTSVKAASMAVSRSGSPLVFFASVYSTSSKTFTKPSVPTTDWVEDDDAGSTTPDFWNEICSMIWSGSGATGDMSATCSASVSTKHAFAVALQPVCSPSISLNTYSWSVNSGNPVTTGSNYATGLTYFTITNNSGGAVDITIGGTNMVGGGYTWTLSDTATPGDMVYGLKAGLSGGDYTIIVKRSTPYNTLVSGLANNGTQSFGMKLWTPTVFSDGNTKSGNVTLTAVCS